MKNVENWKMAFNNLVWQLKECKSENELEQVKNKMELFASQLQGLNSNISLAIIPTQSNSPMPLEKKIELIELDVIGALQKLEDLSINKK